MNSRKQNNPSFFSIIFCLSLLVLVFMIPWGFVQFVAGRGLDWLVFSAATLIVFAPLFCEV